MFTLAQIQNAHSKVKSGADFPQYVRDLIDLGVERYDFFVSEGFVTYHGSDTSLESEKKYAPLTVAATPNLEKFTERLKIHQSGGTDTITFCQDAAENGVEKWILDFSKKTCTYFDQTGNVILVENLPI